MKIVIIEDWIPVVAVVVAALVLIGFILFEVAVHFGAMSG